MKPWRLVALALAACAVLALAVAFATGASLDLARWRDAVAQQASAGPESAAGMLALAQRLHDEYVRNGQEEGNRIVAEARANGENLVREAETKRDETLQQLENERTLLERKIDELRNFEREYRSRLKSYLEGLLADVDSRGKVSAEMGDN